MKTILLLTAFLSFQFIQVQAQNVGLDKSPLDYAYFPDNFAHDRSDGEKAIVRVTYSRPQLNGRKMFGDKIAYDKMWRTGANESTEIKIYQDITIGGKKLNAGIYSLFTIPGKTEWTIIFNSELDYWGNYSYKEASDVLRIIEPSSQNADQIEAFTIVFEKKEGNSGAMTLAWEKTIVSIPFSY